MEENGEKCFAEIKKAMSALPLQAQNTIWWISENFDTAKEICEDLALTPDEIEEGAAGALAEKDYFILGLPLLSKTLQEFDTGTGGQPDP